jgi:hypothetical protein
MDIRRLVAAHHVNAGSEVKASPRVVGAISSAIYLHKLVNRITSQPNVHNGPGTEKGGAVGSRRTDCQIAIAVPIHISTT